MNKARNISLVAGLLILTQLFIFRGSLLPAKWGTVKVDGLACTCPDAAVLSGRLYLRASTPDSLRAYALDYSEVFLTQRPSTSTDRMGGKSYFITGRVVGKQRVSQYDRWNPVIQVEAWEPNYPFIKWGAVLLMLLTFAVWGFLMRKTVP